MAVVDDGVNMNHPDLVSNFVSILLIIRDPNYEYTMATERMTPIRKCVCILLQNFRVTLIYRMYSVLIVCRYKNFPLLNMLRMRSVPL